MPWATLSTQLLIIDARLDWIDSTDGRGKPPGPEVAARLRIRCPGGLERRAPVSSQSPTAWTGA